MTGGLSRETNLDLVRALCVASISHIHHIHPMRWIDRLANSALAEHHGLLTLFKIPLRLARESIRRTEHAVMEFTLRR